MKSLISESNFLNVLKLLKYPTSFEEVSKSKLIYRAKNLILSFITQNAFCDFDKRSIISEKNFINSLRALTGNALKLLMKCN